MNFPQTLIVFICAIVFLGCPYESQAPIGDSVEDPKADIVGTWQRIGKFHTRISRIGKSDFLILGNESDNADQVEVVMRGFFTRVSGKELFHIQFLADSEGFHTASPFVFAKLMKKGDTLCYLLIEKDFITERLKKQQKLADIIKDNWDNKEMWEGSDCLSKVK